MKTSTQIKKAFTLIELLIVIAIIGILMGLLFPAVSGALHAARRAQAQNDITQISNACIAYATEYGMGPYDPLNMPTQVNGNLLEKLMGANPRSIVFIEVQDVKDKRGKSGFDGDAFIDPWGGAYQITFDRGESSLVTDAGTNRSTRVRKNVAVWTDPSRQPNTYGLPPDRRYVESW